MTCDESLYRQCLSGDDEGLNALMKKYGDPLTLYIDGYLHDVHEAEELMLDVFAYLFTKKPKIRDGGFKAYLYKAARHMALRHKSKRKPLFSLDELTGEPDGRLLAGMFCAMGASTLLNTTLNLVTPLLFASSPAFFVNLLFFTQGIGTSGSQSLLGRYATDIGFWHKTNLVLLALGAAAVLLLAFSTVPGPRADGPHPAKRQSGVLKNRAALPLVFVFGFYFIAEHGVMNWLVAYATAGLGMEQAKASNYLAVFFGGVMLGRLVLSPLVDRLGILKSMGVFGSLSAVLYIAGVVGGAAAMPLWAASGFFLSILYPTLVMSIRLFFPHGQVAGAAGTIISVASLFDILFNVGFGRLVDTLGYGVSIYVLPLAMAAFIITFLAFSRGHGKEQQKN